MQDNSFTTTLSLEQTPAEVFNAINNVRGWWSEEIKGSTDKLSEVFDYHYKDLHRCQIQIVELNTNEKVEWQVLDNYFKFTKDKSEWKGTQVVFDITRERDKTQLRFTHRGLVPEYECYNVCFDAWTNFIEKSLYKLITTGKGEPITSTGNQFQTQVEARVNE